MIVTIGTLALIGVLFTMSQYFQGVVGTDAGLISAPVPRALMRARPETPNSRGEARRGLRPPTAATRNRNRCPVPGPSAPSLPVSHAAVAFGYAAAGNPTATSRRRAPIRKAYRWLPPCTTSRTPAAGSASRSQAAPGSPGGLTQGDPDLLNPISSFRFRAKHVDTGSSTLDMGMQRFGPDISRFLTPDLFYGALSNFSLSIDPLTQNRYGLAGGNPISFREWDGHQFITDGGGGAATTPTTATPPTPADRCGGCLDGFPPPTPTNPAPSPTTNPLQQRPTPTTVAKPQSCDGNLLQQALCEAGKRAGPAWNQVTQVAGQAWNGARDRAKDAIGIVTQVGGGIATGIDKAREVVLPVASKLSAALRGEARLGASICRR
jgi:hypothetical protein